MIHHQQARDHPVPQRYRKRRNPSLAGTAPEQVWLSELVGLSEWASPSLSAFQKLGRSCRSLRGGGLHLGRTARRILQGHCRADAVERRSSRNHPVCHRLQSKGRPPNETIVSGSGKTVCSVCWRTLKIVLVAVAVVNAVSITGTLL